LVAEIGVAAWQSTSDRVAKAQGIARDMERVEAVMIEPARQSLHP
jgi:hypothetical protein